MYFPGYKVSHNRNHTRVVLSHIMAYIARRAQIVYISGNTENLKTNLFRQITCRQVKAPRQNLQIRQHAENKPAKTSTPQFSRSSMSTLLAVCRSSLNSPPPKAPPVSFGRDSFIIKRLFVAAALSFGFRDRVYILSFYFILFGWRTTSVIDVCFSVFVFLWFVFYFAVGLSSTLFLCVLFPPTNWGKQYATEFISKGIYFQKDVIKLWVSIFLIIAFDLTIMFCFNILKTGIENRNFSSAIKIFWRKLNLDSRFLNSNFQIVLMYSAKM